MKKLKQGALSVCEYKYRFNKIVAYFSDLFDKDKHFFFATGLQASIKHDVKALKPHTLRKHIGWL